MKPKKNLFESIESVTQGDALAQGKAAPPITPKSRRDMRALAFHFLYAVDRFDYTVSLEQVIKNFKNGFNLIVDDDSLAIRMARGAIELRDELDEQIKPLLRNWRLERLGCCTRLILRLALWELHQPEAIPSIVINEAIELAKSFAEKDAYKFVNGILDEASKKFSQDNGDTRGVDEHEPSEQNQQNQPDQGE